MHGEHGEHSMHHAFHALLSAGCAGSATLQQVAVLADTAFNPEAVDEVAARHVNASCVVRQHAKVTLMHAWTALPAYMPHGMSGHP